MGSRNSQVLRLGQQHEVPELQNSLIHYAIHKITVKSFLVNVRNVNYILSAYTKSLAFPVS